MSIAELLECIEISLVLWLDFGDGEACGGLLANKGTKTGLGLDDAVRDASGLAEGRQPHDDLNGVDVVSDDDQLGFLLLDELGDVVDSHLDAHWLLGGSVATSSLLLSSISNTLRLLGLGLGLELVEETEELTSLTLVECALELVDCWGELKALVQDAAGALQTDVLWPLDESGEVAGGTDVTTDGEGATLLLDHV